MNGAVHIQHRSGNVVNGPSLDPTFEELTSFANDILQYSRQVLRGLQTLRSQYCRDQLNNVEGLRSQIEVVQEDISDVKRAKFDGLRRIFRDRHPEC